MASVLDIGPDEFTDLVRKGRGAAILALREQPSAPFRAVIESACRSHYSYLKDDEACRAEYAYDLMTASGEFSYYRTLVLDALDSTLNWIDRSQLFRIAVSMVKEGDLDAKSRVWQAFSHGMQTRGDTIGGDEIIETAGRDGLLFVLRQFARRGATTYLGEVPAWFETLAESHGNEAAREAEEYCRFEDAELRALMEWADSSEDIRSEKPLTRDNYADFESLKSFVDEYGFRQKDLYILHWSIEATDIQAARAAGEMLKQTDWEILTAYLEIYAHRDFPLDPHLLFEFALHENDSVSRASLIALSRFVGPDIRSFALRILAHDTPRPEAVLLLSKNYQKPDALLLQGLMGKIDDADYYDRLCAAAVTVLQENLEPETLPTLLSIFETSLCPICRYHAVEMLGELDRIPRWMAQECRWDSYIRTRELVADHGDDSDSSPKTR